MNGEVWIRFSAVLTPADQSLKARSSGGEPGSGSVSHGLQAAIAQSDQLLDCGPNKRGDRIALLALGGIASRGEHVSLPGHGRSCAELWQVERSCESWRMGEGPEQFVQVGQQPASALDVIPRNVNVAAHRELIVPHGPSDLPAKRPAFLPN
jgi:hypothetical protein